MPHPALTRSFCSLLLLTGLAGCQSEDAVLSLEPPALPSPENPAPEMPPAPEPTPQLEAPVISAPQVPDTNPNSPDNVLVPPQQTASPSSPASTQTAGVQVSGTVYDENRRPLEGVSISLRSTDPQRPFSASTTTQAGVYQIVGVPTGLALEISAQRPGYTRRQRLETLSRASQIDFAPPQYALSDRPEVQAVTSEHGSERWAPDSPLILSFSEPMNRASVLERLLIRSRGAWNLSVNQGGPSLSSPLPIWNQAAFQASWNSDDSELTLRFREQKTWPSDHQDERAPSYELIFTGPIQDKLGVSSQSQPFFLNGHASQGFAFSVQPDRLLPQTEALQALSAEKSGASQGDVLKLRFNKPMLHKTLGASLAGGLNQVASEAPAAHGSIGSAAAAENYRISVSRNGQKILQDISWSALGGEAVFDALDPSFRIVSLEPPSIELSSGNQTVGEATDMLQAITGRIYYRDGSEAEFSVEPTDSTWPAIKTALDSLLHGTPFTAKKAQGNQTEIVAGDVYQLSLAANALDLSQEKQVALVWIASQGAFAPTQLNAPARGLYLFPGTAATARPDLFKPGDRIEVEVGSQVKDPAGNTISPQHRAITGIAA